MKTTDSCRFFFILKNVITAGTTLIRWSLLTIPDYFFWQLLLTAAPAVLCTGIKWGFCQIWPISSSMISINSDGLVNSDDVFLRWWSYFARGTAQFRHPRSLELTNILVHAHLPCSYCGSSHVIFLVNLNFFSMSNC